MGVDSYNGTRVALALYKSNGGLDTTFGTSGKTLLDVKVAIGGTSYDFTPAAGIMEADGSILMAGSAGGQVELAHFTANGALDTSFGTGGVVTTAVGTSAAARSIALQPDGVIVVAGYSNTSTSLDFLVARYSTGGTLDTTFGGLGYVTTNMGTDSANGLVIQPNGQIMVVGQSSSSFTALRFNADGSLDSGFGTSGIVTTAIPGTTSSSAGGVAIQSDGKLVLVGQGTYSIQGPHGTEQRKEMALVRYNTDGTLDDGTEASVNGPAMVGAYTRDGSLAPLVLDNPDLWDGVAVKKRRDRPDAAAGGISRAKYASHAGCLVEPGGKPVTRSRR